MADLLDRLPPARDVSREIYETAQRARLLRSLHRVLRRIEAELGGDSAATITSGVPDRADAKGGEQ